MAYGFMVYKKTVNGENFYEQYKERDEVYSTTSTSELVTKLNEITKDHAIKHVKVIQNIESSYDTNVTDSLGGGSGDTVLTEAEIDEIYNAAHQTVYGN